MDKYQLLSTVGEGSYGLVLKCKHKETDQLVAIKKFLETEEDSSVRRMALREIRMLKKLRHENLVAMIEVFRNKKRFYIVFEYVEGTVLDELESTEGGLNSEACRERIFQVTRAVNFCHMNNVIHRDIKPENVLVSSLGVVKLCDFGFARLVSIAGDNCTEYVATRWYRAPELLIGELNYGAPVDIWAIGCLYAEMMTGNPLFPGESDIDQLYLTMQLLGRPCVKHQHLMFKTKQFGSMIKAAPNDVDLNKAFPNWSHYSLEFFTSCMEMDPQKRPTSDELLRHNFFTHDNFVHRFLPKLRQKVIHEFNDKPLLRKYKSQILASTDSGHRKENFSKFRKSTHVEVPKWQININESSAKRKFSYDTLNETTSNENSIQNMIKDKINKECSYALQGRQNSFNSCAATKKLSEMQIEKSAPNLNKLIQEDTRSASSIKQEMRTTSSTLVPPSPPRFQSLQSGLSEFTNKSPSRLTLQQITQTSQNVLHPSISNICFPPPQDAQPKRSPNVLQAVQNTSIRSLFNQVPLLQTPKLSQITKKADKNNFDLPINGESLSQISFVPSWLCNGGNQKVKRREKYKCDDFSLPVVPGATGSPNKPTKKPQTSPEDLLAQNVTPDIRYKKAKRKHVFTDNNNPYNSKNEKG